MAWFVALPAPPRGAPAFPHPPQGLHPYWKEVRQQLLGPPHQPAARGHRQALWASRLKSLGHSRARPLLWGHWSGQGALGCQGCGGEPGAHGGFCRPGKAGLPVTDFNQVNLLTSTCSFNQVHGAKLQLRGAQGGSQASAAWTVSMQTTGPARGPGCCVSAAPCTLEFGSHCPWSLCQRSSSPNCSSLLVCRRFVSRKTLGSWQHCKTSHFVESQRSSKTSFFLMNLLFSNVILN